jgi:hypothetical protein
VIRWKSSQKQPMKRIQTAFEAARVRANLSPVITPYSIRHTVAVELRKRGVSMSEVAGFMGHRMERYATTEIYAKRLPRGRAVPVQLFHSSVPRDIVVQLNWRILILPYARHMLANIWFEGHWNEACANRKR